MSMILNIHVNMDMHVHYFFCVRLWLFVWKYDFKDDFKKEKVSQTLNKQFNLYIDEDSKAKCDLF